MLFIMEIYMTEDFDERSLNKFRIMKFMLNGHILFCWKNFAINIHVLI